MDLHISNIEDTLIHPFFTEKEFFHSIDFRGRDLIQFLKGISDRQQTGVCKNTTQKIYITKKLNYYYIPFLNEKDFFRTTPFTGSNLSKIARGRNKTVCPKTSCS